MKKNPPASPLSCKTDKSAENSAKPIDEMGKWDYNTAIIQQTHKICGERSVLQMMMEYGMCCCRMSGFRARCVREGSAVRFFANCSVRR